MNVSTGGLRLGLSPPFFLLCSFTNQEREKKKQSLTVFIVYVRERKKIQTQKDSTAPPHPQSVCVCMYQCMYVSIIDIERENS